MSISVEKCFHIGHVVPDLTVAMERLTACAGLRWAAPRKRPAPLRTTSGDIVTDVRLTYSLQGPPHLELIEEQPGTIWSSEHRGLHHIGYWSSRFSEEIDELVDAGFAFEAAAVDESGALTRFAYLREPHSGLRVELLDEARRPSIEQWLREGASQSHP